MDHDEYRKEDGYSSDALRWFAAGIGMGLLVGAAVGILLAPKSGRETREQIKEIATDLGDRARVVARDLGDRATTTYGTVSSKTREVTENIRERAKGSARLVGEKVAAGREVATEALSAAKEGYRRKVEELGARGYSDGEGDIEIEDVGMDIEHS